MKRQYILKQKEIQETLKKGEVFKCSVLVFYFHKSSTPIAKLGVAISKKIKPIVKKNKVRRQIKMLMTKPLLTLSACNVVIIAKHNYFDFTFVQIEAFIEQVLEKWHKN